MGLLRRHVLWGFAVSLAVASAAHAQPGPRNSRIGYVYPAGGRQGTTFQVKVGGQFIDAATEAYISGNGVQAKVFDHFKPINAQQANKLKDQLKELMDKRAAAMRGRKGRGKAKGPSEAKTPAPEAKWTAEDEKLIAEIRKKLATFVRRPPNPAIAETVTLEVGVAADAEPGECELRLGVPLGLTNPLVFCVGQLAEFAEKDPKQAAESKEAPPGKFGKKNKGTVEPKSGVPVTETTFSLPATVNGQILPGEVDRFRFTARKGQRLVAVVRARRLIPYLPDAVPGWFQATMAICDSQGRELAYAEAYRFDPDPVLFYEIPADGEYVMEIKDSIYRGREDFVYRVTVGELPFVTSIFPLGGPAGAKTTVELKGWNLPAAQMTLDNREKTPGVSSLVAHQGEWVSNRMAFALDTLPECSDQEPNDAPAPAQQVTVPIIVNGRVDRPDDCDVFRFEGRAGQEIVAEVYARRLSSPLDSQIQLTDAAGKQLAANDDHEDKGAGLLTHHADSWLQAKLPADGTYYLRLSDSQHKGGAEYAYRLRISPPRPDFDLRVVPSSISARAGATVPVTVHALRRDGFAGDITVGVKDPPTGFAFTGGRVPGNQEQVRATLTVPTTSQERPFSLNLEGRATIEGREVSHAAVPAEDMMQAFAYRHLVPARELRVAVAGRSVGKTAAKILSATPVKLPAGGTTRVEIGVPAGTLLDRLTLALNDAPDGITIKEISPTAQGTAIVLQSDAAKVRPGLKGNLIVTASVRRAGAAAKAKPQKNQPAVPVTSLPAIPFEIVVP